MTLRIFCIKLTLGPDNLVFIIRSLQKNSKGKNTGLDKLGDDEIYVVTSSANGGFTMSVFFGNNLICVGEYANHRESAMNGLRRRVEKMISSIIESKAKATKNVERKGSEVVLNKVAAEMDAVDDSPASEATAADDQAADSSGNALSPGGISLAVMGEAPLESSQFVPNGTWTPGIIPVSALPPHSLAQLQAPQSVSSSSSGDPHLSDLSDEE